jgi:hypothetical protein
MGSPSVDQLGAQDAEALRAWLAQDPAQHLFLLGLLEEYGLVSSPTGPPFSWHGARLDGALKAVLFVGGDGGLVVPACSELTALEAIASHLAPRVTLKASRGERSAVDCLVRHLCPEKPSLSRPQRLHTVSADDLGPFTNPTLRLATLQDLEQLVSLSAAAIQESIQRDPLQEDASAFRDRVRQRIEGRRSYVLADGDRLIFKVEVGARSLQGAELENPYTLPEVRRRGHATLSMGQIARHLLSSLPRLVMRIDDTDAALSGVARKVGFIAGRPQRLVLA